VILEQEALKSTLYAYSYPASLEVLLIPESHLPTATSGPLTTKPEDERLPTFAFING